MSILSYMKPIAKNDWVRSNWMKGDIHMSKRGDNIRKRKDGRWEGRYKKGRKPDGSIQYGSIYGKSYREVKSRLSEIAKTPLFTPSSPKEKTFSDVLELWMENSQIRLKGGTINKYRNMIDTHIAPELGNVKISAVSSTLINNYLRQKLQNGRLDNKGGLSPSYVRSIMLIINAAIKFAVAEQLCPPLKTPILKPSNSKTEITVLSVEEQKKLENYLCCELDSTKAGVFISLHTGLRIGEVCALSWDDIDFKNKVIKIRHTVARVRNDDGTKKLTKLIIDGPKTQSSARDIPISTSLLPILEEAHMLSVSSYVISENAQFTSPRTYEYRYHRLLDKSGIASVNYHTLRHTFATRCIEAGVDVKSLSEILGHSNVGITLNTYVHSSMDLKRTQLEKLTMISD